MRFYMSVYGAGAIVMRRSSRSKMCWMARNLYQILERQFRKGVIFRILMISIFSLDEHHRQSQIAISLNEGRYIPQSLRT